jgi:hypothetical protein
LYYRSSVPVDVSNSDPGARKQAATSDQNCQLVTQDSSPEAKIDLFRSLFRGRTDVFPLRFESQRTGKSGYSRQTDRGWLPSNSSSSPRPRSLKVAAGQVCRCREAPSRRDRLIVARYEVPGKASLERSSRRIRYDQGAPNPRGIPDIFQHRFVSNLHSQFDHTESSNRCAHLHESYRTLRDGSLGWRFSRHFVPGYDRTVPPGHSARPLPRCCGEMSTSASRRDRLKFKFEEDDAREP